MNTMYVLIMIIAASGNASSGITTLKVDSIDQQTCSHIQQDIDEQVGRTHGRIVSENCYSVPGGNGSN